MDATSGVGGRDRGSDPVALIFISLVLLYQGWTYHVFQVENGLEQGLTRPRRSIVGTIRRVEGNP